MELLRYICFCTFFSLVQGDSQLSSQIEELSDKLDKEILVHQHNMAHMSTVVEFMVRLLHRLDVCDERETCKADLAQAKQTLAETEQALAEALEHPAMQDEMETCKTDLAEANQTLAETEQALAEALDQLAVPGNLALNKPAFLKQLYDDYVAGRTVDGNTDPDVSKCAICGNVDQAWWAVDLGAKTHVGKVRLLSTTAGGHAVFLSNFQIGVSDVSPEEQEPTLDNYTVCATQVGQLPIGEFTDFQCGEEGRYVIVQRKDKNYLVICEAEVYRGM